MLSWTTEQESRKITLSKPRTNLEEEISPVVGRDYCLFENYFQLFSEFVLSNSIHCLQGLSLLSASINGPYTYH